MSISKQSKCWSSVLAIVLFKCYHVLYVIYYFFLVFVFSSAQAVPQGKKNCPFTLMAILTVSTESSIRAENWDFKISQHTVHICIVVHALVLEQRLTAPVTSVSSEDTAHVSHNEKHGSTASSLMMSVNTKNCKFWDSHYDCEDSQSSRSS